jgi:hypothetical protein
MGTPVIGGTAGAVGPKKYRQRLLDLPSSRREEQVAAGEEAGEAVRSGAKAAG